MDVPTTPDDALAQPTRARLFALLAELRRPAGTEELAERVGLHPNGVRAHLERLHDDGLVERRRERQARGRPRDVWAVSPAAQPGGRPPTGYTELSRWLVRALANRDAGVRAVEATGRTIGRELAQSDDRAGDVPAEERMHGTLVSLGFQPSRERDGEHLVYCLGNCPYRDAVRASQPLICGLHRGMTRGLLDALDPQTKLAAFIPKDPDTAGCRIELRGPLAAEPAAPAAATAPEKLKRAGSPD